MPGETEKVLTNVKWKLVRDESTYSRFQAVLEGDVFVYEPDVSRYPLSVEAPLPQIRVTITAKDGESTSENEAESVSGDGVSENRISPEFSRMMVTGGVRIKVEAPEGVFPEDAELSVKKIDDEDSTGKIKNTVGASANVAAFDIAVRDASGNEIQPDTEHGTVTVTFENVNIVKDSAAKEGAQVSVYHFEDGLESGEKLNAEVDAQAGSAAVEAEHFSPFVVVVEGGEEEAAGDGLPPIDKLIDYALEQGWIKINGVNADSPNVPRAKSKVFEYISDNDVNYISQNGSSWYSIKFSLNNGAASLSNAVKGEKYDNFIDPNSSEYSIVLSLWGNSTMIWYPTGYNKTFGIYPRYDQHKESVEIVPPKPITISYDGQKHPNVVSTDYVRVSIDLISENNVKIYSLSTNDVKGYYKGGSPTFTYYRIDNATKKKDGEYVLPTDPNQWSKYSKTKIEQTDIENAGIYGCAATVEIKLEDLAQGTEEKLKYFRNTVSNDTVGGFNGYFTINPETGVFFQITKRDIKEPFEKNLITVSSGDYSYEKDGHQMFEIASGGYSPLPPLTDSNENVKYYVFDKDKKVVKTGLVSSPPTIVEPGTYTVSFDATEAVNYKGTYYDGTKKVTISKRDLSDKNAEITVSPDKVYVPSGTALDPVKPTVKVTWKNKNGIKELLTEGVDYTLEYSNNTKITSSAKVTVSGMGSYIKGQEKYFEIIASKDSPKVRFRGEDENDPTDKPRDWYNVGVKFSGKPEGELTYDAKISGQDDYARESDSFKKEGEGVEANLFLRASTGAVYNLPQHVNIDLTVPTGSITVDGTQYAGLDNTDGSIGTYTTKSVTATAAGNDALSGVAGMDYYITDSPTPKTLANLQNMGDTEWTVLSGNRFPSPVENKNSYIYLRVRDKAGNKGFASAKGVCYDTIAPVLSKVVSVAANNKLTLEFTASDALSGVATYYALVKKPSDPEPTKDDILKGTKSEKPSFPVDKKSDASDIYCVVKDRAGNVSDIKKVTAGSDTKSPTGTIKIMDKTWDSVQSETKTAAYTREKQLISITGSDASSGVKKIEYYVSTKSYTTAASIQALSSNVWKTYSDGQKPEIEHNVLNYVYAKITDGSGNLGFVSTEGVWHDTIVPKNTKLATSKIKDTSLTVTVTGSDDESGVDCYYALVRKADLDAPDNKAVESGGTKSEKADFELKGLVASNSYKVYSIVKDKAGNLSEVKSQAFSTTKPAGGSSASGKGSASSKTGSGSKSQSSKDKQKAAADAYRQQAGITGGTTAAGSGVDSVAIPTRIPFIKDATEGIAKGEQLTSGWQKIETESVKASEPAEMHIQMNGATVVPAALLKTIENKNITVYFMMNDDYVWAVNGLSFTGDPTQDIDFRVRKDTKNIPADMVNKIADVYPHTCLSLEHSGDFGFKGILSIPFGGDKTGMYANLYYYNEPESRLDFVDSAVVKDTGRTEFEFTHASDYMIVLRGDALTEKSAADLEAENLGTAGDEGNEINPRSGLSALFTVNNRTVWIFVITILSLILCAVVLFAPDNKKKVRAA